ncbi:MAG: Methionyl-tRNA synthetase [Candidatus Falkowbacteria bacterium GW2011_GWC2_38_22]|uniref:Methionine--tRNA ligase n=1 Tax=Candidatus Falkowbacteria bacterium GW2011_GWE1_38_31 TaxID=1618638 RepID=A0A0G0K5N3_9BACT|nr:MAG: Methionyl-tRNA synthetase [Candidatus Falkowbacteria bacterium GW2011_GWF2_38_1205]KKQ61938.1 MAG: Methionyl-tRNA synthetase [Candidatus Falkowbacteria bacterium GW2011_GWC2_38_22]KKQ63900.1 MAG: Methionyl-tRNA synthetase [Candidatus Falkowbacteria bacterium GW2011_GWF1_38_22]KKQ66157.1 MAG: Methionyl-tRNA synthetase [Candidatus Falkowbacteria bacterium GW2011_GWE2_38_254]KKQ70760.1 MAG: Methionyl-tRNA synthetase [Candidatus Falkowbacteria bacterium GW2011_GWE1_38_31]KKQ73130.1 MAG: Me
MDKEKFYITTTLPYVNADPHIGFAAEIVRADVLARWARQEGKDVFFNTGTDEYGLKIFRKAEERGVRTQEYTDEYAARFDDLKKALNLSYNSFIRTTDERHKRLAGDFWKKCAANGDIYKKAYKIKYCVGCELELTESELVDGKCPHHPGQELELIEEENYFFKWSAYADKLLDFYEKNPDFIVPAHRMNEIKAFIGRGLQDFSISRLKSKMPWGVSVPGDSEHVMYVWFDALTNYINCLDWDKDFENFTSIWGTKESPNAIQVAGKDNLRQQTAMWQAMLMSAGFPTSKQILIFGFITSDGQKMSKSIGNVVNPHDLVKKYGVDAVRYYLLADLKPFEDSDYTEEKFRAKFQADLANGLGNLVARTSNLIEKNELEFDLMRNSDQDLIIKFRNEIQAYHFDEALNILWSKLREMDEYISIKAPWKMTDKAEISEVLKIVAQNILNVADLLQPFLPETAEKIIQQFSAKRIKKGDSLFPRL